MQGVAQLWVIDPEITSQGMDPNESWRRHKVDSSLHLIEQGQHLTGIIRIARGHPVGKDKARSGLGQNPRFTTTLGQTIAFAFDDRGNGRIIRINDFELAQLCALSEALRLFDHLTMSLAGGFEVAKQVLALGLAELGILV